ncbi:MAG: hypothetical protein EU517_01405 [Promethearchaeota archaeon]|nr:MAG: hypothetical protein EU517_01405 [Candidatus Lokiarchaeota archaeon]
MIEMEQRVNFFSLDAEEESFKKVYGDYENFLEALDSKSVYLIVDPKNKVAWIWNGAKASVRAKFIATQKAPLVRDEYCFDFKIIGIDEDNEPTEFKSFLGLYE